MYINAQQFILCIILPTQYTTLPALCQLNIPQCPHYHNTNHVLHRLYVITSNTKDVRCNVADIRNEDTDICNEKTVIINFKKI